MSQRQFFRLVHDTARQMAVRAVARAPEGMVVEIKPKTRSLDQNARLHAMLADVSKQALFHCRWLSPTEWKVIFVSGHSMATGQGAKVVPGLEGEFVNLREETSKMSVSRLNSLMTYIEAWAADNGVRFSGSAE